MYSLCVLYGRFFTAKVTQSHLISLLALQNCLRKNALLIIMKSGVLIIFSVKSNSSLSLLIQKRLDFLAICHRMREQIRSERN
jgi:hypothetical protein